MVRESEGRDATPSGREGQNSKALERLVNLDGPSLETKLRVYQILVHQASALP